MNGHSDKDIDQKNFEREREYTEEMELADEESKRKFRQKAIDDKETLAYKMSQKQEKNRK